MNIKAIDALTLILATIVLMILAIKYFGLHLGLTIDSDGIAANSTMPLAICIILLTIWKSLKGRKAEGEGQSNA
ncbi:MAG: hypothetical protein ABL928_10225 [Sphingorhabdus sp.]